MNDPKPVGFYVGQIDDGRFAATSTSAPYFCFVATTEVEVVSKAQAALDFYFSHTGTVQRKPQAAKQVTNFVPQRRVEASREYANA